MEGPPALVVTPIVSAIIASALTGLVSYLITSRGWREQRETERLKLAALAEEERRKDERKLRDDKLKRLREAYAGFLAVTLTIHTNASGYMLRALHPDEERAQQIIDENQADYAALRKIQAAIRLEEKNYNIEKLMDNVHDIHSLVMGDAIAALRGTPRSPEKIQQHMDWLKQAMGKLEEAAQERLTSLEQPIGLPIEERPS